uniref:Uncharacterized protein n=1 Tax=Catagonus wagneri TaxID=51154 RepID=A0A8C3X4H7_9CETA
MSCCSSLLQQALHALQEKQAQLKMRLQELQQLKMKLRDNESSPQDKVSWEGVWNSKTKIFFFSWRSRHGAAVNKSDWEPLG